MTSLNAIFERLKNDKKLVVILLVGLTGVILLLFSGDSVEAEASSVDSDEVSVCSVEQTESMLEAKVKSVVAALVGSENISVAVTVEASGEYIYAENLKTEKDENTQSVDSEIVVLSNDSNPALLLCIRAPDIKGVAVVCPGGSSAVVRAEITDLITSLFGIGADKVYVGNKL